MPSPHVTAFQQSSQKVIAHLKGEFAKLQTGRASASVIEHVPVEAYGQMQPLKHLASIAVADARTLTIQPWDPAVLGSVEKALQKANLGCSPVNEGKRLRVVFPPMTEDRRRSLTKVVSDLAEQARIALRQSRQEVHSAIKQEADEDVRRTADGELQREVEKANAEIGELAKRKEEELLRV